MSTQVINPATEETIAQVESLDAGATDAAIDRAHRAFATWRQVSPADRARILRAFAAVVDDHLRELADLEVVNAGHTHANALGEAANVRDVLHYYAGAPERPAGHTIPVTGGVAMTFAEPLGVVGVIVPWNFPMPIAAWGFAPALAAGNTVVLKPAELTPLTALRLGELALQVGLPEGVLQILPGSGSIVGQRFVSHPLVRKVVFTGSTAVGKDVMRGCAENLTRLTLELGGKSSTLVFADADLDAAAAAVPGGAFDNAGQDCCARSRLLVQSGVYEEFLERLEQAIAGVRVGDPRTDVTYGPVISAAHREKVQGYIDDGEVLLQGTAPGGPGYWVAPTVLGVPGRDDRAFAEEVFGPVISVLPFADEAEAIEIANDTVYGLSGSIWTRDVGRALRVARAVESGNLSVNSHSSVRHNTPFGGFKQSGLGRELGPDATEAFTETKTVFIPTD